ncbi:GNAT family N-acetyltransferase [Alicyclobacillus vulcanalis]|uniref:Acetyltransferase (GNAT) family protein n=1 Tax=Alicyclobacillus vulcanalis TaxID=252246 RepID=A0A1N7P094_9BACL|nr:GNAT family N-acetyltransferase [Alicyclobacillus vulcanalis]SIT03990.1 Acetyltransferase (GNAT) family protein [Alicyclobacillus vulcanalis]
MPSPPVRIEVVRPRSAADKRWLAELWARAWGGDVMVSRGQIHRLQDAEAFLAIGDGAYLGAATFILEDEACELLSLNSLTEGMGVGTRLLQAVEHAAEQAGARYVTLITSNDNLKAMRFYLRRGYRFHAVHVGAIDEARKQKPSIPLVGLECIPLHDEIELRKVWST